MTREEKIAELERMLSRAPEIMSPAQVITVQGTDCT